METSGGDSSNERSLKSTEDSWFSQFRNGANPLMARYAYGLSFLLVNVLAWVIRDYMHNTLKEMEEYEGCKGAQYCLGAERVLRVSLGCFMFYLIMFVTTVGTTKLHQASDLWHSGWWSCKIILSIALTALSFLLPSTVIQFYGVIAHFGSGVFLLIQLISIISFINWLSDFCHSERFADRCHIYVMLFATIAYVVCIVGIIMMYIWYVLEPSCLLNIFFITWTLVLLQLMTSVSLHPKVNAGFVTPGLMGIYVVFCCWSAIRRCNVTTGFYPYSEPPETRCTMRAGGTADWLNIISFIVAVLVIAIAIFSTGIDSKSFQFRKDDTQDDDDVPYGYGFFHFVFATGAMYFAMLLIDWNTHHTIKKWTMDVGWTSTWVRIVYEWVAACVYIWMLIAPVIWKSRQRNESI